ncbi:Arc family DNA-binding protein [Christensenellaceae bacterium 44-20]
MTTNTAKFTLRVNEELLKKFRFVADYNARSANRELEILMKKHVAEFEKANGTIKMDEI